jgi:hypothetical protein
MLAIIFEVGSTTITLSKFNKIFFKLRTPLMTRFYLYILGNIGTGGIGFSGGRDFCPKEEGRSINDGIDVLKLVFIILLSIGG